MTQLGCSDEHNTLQVDSVLFASPHCSWLWVRHLLGLDDHKDPNHDCFFEMTKFSQFANRSHTVQVQSVLSSKMFAKLKKRSSVGKVKTDQSQKLEFKEIWLVSLVFVLVL